MLTALLLLATAIVSPGLARDLPDQLRNYLEAVGFDNRELESVRRDEAVAVVEKTGDQAEVLVYGVVFVDSPSSAFVELYRDLDALGGNEGFLAVGEFSDPPAAPDLEGYRFAKTDFDDLRTCRLNDCKLQLGADGIELMQQIDWDSPSAEAQANEYLKNRTLHWIREYRQKGNRALGVLLNQKYDRDVRKTFESLVSRIQGLKTELPEVKDYLVNYPQATLPNSADYFYWEKVNFGLKTTLRVNHVIIYEPRPDELSGRLVINKQLWASHYFQSALDVWVCIEDKAGPGRGGFYLLTAKISRQEALSGFKGGIIRSVAVPRARRGIKSALVTFKRELEKK